MRDSVMIVAIMLLAGCAAHGNKSMVEPKRKRPARDLVQVCETRVISRNCYYVDRRELERAMREAQGQR